VEKSTVKKACGTCFFTEDVPGVIIEDNGSCNFCNSGVFIEENDKLTFSNLEELKKIAEKIRNTRQGKYDCIIGASGGLDSSFVIYVVKKLLDLNPLVVNYENPFSKNLAKENLQEICRSLGVDLKTIKSRQGYDKKYVRSISRALIATDAYWGCCAFCNYILPVVIHNEAVKAGIKTIFGSYNLFENRSTRYLTKSYKIKFMLKNLWQARIKEKIRFVLYLISAQYYFIRFKLENPAEVIFKTIFSLTTISALFQQPVSRITSRLQVINVTEYIKWDIYEIVAVLKKELNWIPPDEPYLPMRFDCRLEDGFIEHTYKRAIGITLRGIMCNHLIYAGVKKREDLESSIRVYESDMLVEREKLISELTASLNSNPEKTLSQECD